MVFTALLAKLIVFLFINSLPVRRIPLQQELPGNLEQCHQKQCHIKQCDQKELLKCGWKVIEKMRGWMREWMVG
jgi:hypothetical protein